MYHGINGYPNLDSDEITAYENVIKGLKRLQDSNYPDVIEAITMLRRHKQRFLEQEWYEVLATCKNIEDHHDYRIQMEV